MNISVIAPAEGGRHGPLIEQLERLERHTYALLPAVIQTEIPPGFDMAAARAVNNRDLTPGEIGCAASHRNAYLEIIRSGAEWGFVMEDDARIVDLPGFAALLDEIEQVRPAERGTVINLFVERAVLTRWPNSTFTPCWTEPPFAVAVAISREAARRLAAANESQLHTADWPRRSGVRFMMATRHTVAHGDLGTESIIGGARNEPAVNRKLRRGNVSLHVVSNRLALYTFVHYWRNRQYFDGVRDYAGTLLHHRIATHIGRWFGRRCGLAPDVRVLSLRRRPRR